MRAALIEAGAGTVFTVHDVIIDHPDGQEVVVDVKAAGLCHSDHFAAELEFFPAPVLLGHEVAGVVAQVGPDVSDIAVGDHVVVCEHSFCGACDRCHAGEPTMCRKRAEATERGSEEPPRIRKGDVPITQAFGVAGFAEQVLVHSSNAVKIDPRMPLDRACLLGCGAVTGLGAIFRVAKVTVGDTVAVIGCGGVGLHAVQGARIAGAQRVIAIDTNPMKLDLATRFGATDVVDASRAEVVETVLGLTDGGVDFAVEVVGGKATAEQAYAMLGPRGTALLVGTPRPGTVLEIDPFDGLMKSKGLRSVGMGSANARIDIPRYVDLYLQGRLLLDELVSRRIGLEDINGAYEALAAGETARAVVVFE